MNRLLDDKDEALWLALREDPSSTNRALSAKLGVPEVEVAKRLRRLDEADLMRLSASLDLIGAGYSALAHVFLQCRAGEELKMSREILASPLASRLLTLHSVVGQGGLEATLRLTGSQELNDITTRQFLAVPTARAFTLDLAYEILWYRNDVMGPFAIGGGAVADLAAYVRTSVLTRTLDDLDTSIVAELQLDGRQSIRNIARKYGVTEGTIRYRLKRLDEIPLLRVAPVRHPQTMGFEARARVFVRVSPLKLREVLTRLPSDALLFAALSTGDSNLHLALAGETDEQLAERVATIREMPGVSNVRVSQLKDVYFYDSRWRVTDRMTLPAAD